MRVYPSKILLFGEYILLTGGTALAVPVPAYFGKWAENPKSQPPEWRQQLLGFANSSPLKAVAGLDATAFLQDLEGGIAFDSNIPVGYGLGSSGALCAAVYDRYCRRKTEGLNELKEILAGMEGFFHGASSGIDPLTSYMGRPLLIRQKTNAEFAETSVWDNAPMVFLIDSQTPRKTADLVPWFLGKTREPEFSAAMSNTYLPASELALGAWLRADARVFWPNLRTVSRFQLENFTPMVPATMRELWSKSLEGDEVLFKICGAGGGGYMLGFCRAEAPVAALCDQYKVVFPFSTNKP